MSYITVFYKTWTIIVSEEGCFSKRKTSHKLPKDDIRIICILVHVGYYKWHILDTINVGYYK